MASDGDAAPLAYTVRGAADALNGWVGAVVTIGDVFARNLRATRQRRGLSVRALSERLGALGYPVLPTGITKAESPDREKRRRVTVEELAALAVALDTSPAFLLGALTDPSERVALTPVVREDPEIVESWTRGEMPPMYPLPHRPASDTLEARTRDFLDAASQDAQRSDRLSWHDSIQAVKYLEHAMGDAYEPEENRSPAEIAEWIRRAAADVAKHVELIAGRLERGTDKKAGR